MSAVPFVQIITDSNRIGTPCGGVTEDGHMRSSAARGPNVMPPREMLVWLCVHHSISHRLGQYGTARAAVSALIAYLLSGKVLDKVVAARGLVLIALHMSCKPRNEGVGLKI